jgi:hypothetical protein
MAVGSAGRADTPPSGSTHSTTGIVHAVIHHTHILIMTDMSIPTSTQRRCFTRGCAGIPVGTAWECDECRARIHAASEAATARAARRRRARQLAATVPHTKLASDLPPLPTRDAKATKQVAMGPSSHPGPAGSSRVIEGFSHTRTLKVGLTRNPVGSRGGAEASDCGFQTHTVPPREAVDGLLAAGSGLRSGR